MSAIAASYARYSSDLQDVSSIAQQQRKCRDAAAANGHTLDPDLEFADEAVSGTKRQRDGLNALLAAAKAGRFGVVYFESLSRLARESVITMPLLKELVYVHRVRIVSVSEGIDSNNGSWDLVASIMAAVHEQFLKGLRAAVLRGQEQAVLADWSAGHWCFGYGSEPIPGTETARRGRHPRPRMRVVVNPDHAEWVRRIFRWFADDGRSLDGIARELTRRNAPKDHRSTTAGWHHDYVRRVLRNEKYIGLWHWGRATNVRNPLTGQIAQEGRPPEEAAKWVRERADLRIVDDALYFRAQAKLDENEAAWDTLRAEKGRFRGSRAGTAAGRHLLQGVFRCGACGATFQVNGANGKYLGCAGYKKGLCGCKTRLPRARAEALLLGVIRDRVLGRPEWVAEVVAEARRAWREQRTGADDPIAEIMKKLGGGQTPEPGRRVVGRPRRRECGPPRPGGRRGHAPGRP